ncbi:MAG: manganese efflux pump MntP family protein [Prevotella sp.]|nr:manganese efflux pump MntP family protein [Staphylococcus sp.]MCM1350733.1 manganese efflux pump MntP family protein [Prevotella sp.]
MTLQFVMTSIFLGIGLAMDAFSVSLANGLNEPHMRIKKITGIAFVFAFFQAVMPMIGWICIHTIVEYFTAFERIIPWLALLLLGTIGIKMIVEGIKHNHNELEKPKVGFLALIIQGIATSIDALSVGFTISEYNVWMALICAVIIAVVTFFLSLLGIWLGKKFGTKLSNKAEIFGGIILIIIGLEIFITDLLSRI